MEMHKPVRMAHKLSKKVIQPTPMEKMNVKLADAFFHESTIGAINYHARDSKPHWSDTANFLSLFRKLWNILNVRTPQAGFHKRDESKMAITNNNLDNLKISRRLLLLA